MTAKLRPVARKLAWFVVAVSAIYLMSAVCLLDFTSFTATSDVEQPDDRGREPALGPRVRGVGWLLCRPTGPSCSLLGNDYAGDEWLWSFYRPIVRLWFRLPMTRYYFPYDSIAKSD